MADKTIQRIKKYSTIGETLSLLLKILDEKVPDPQSSAEYILSEILQISIPMLKISLNENLDRKFIQKAITCANRRAQNEPLQYIFRKAYFRKLELIVGPGVLIPRPETELILEGELEKIPVGGIVCDVGVGSGAIAISIASERSDCTVYASDISPEAITFAKKNFRKYGLKNIKIKKGSLLEPFKNIRFNAIFANLPYIKNSDIKNLPCEIRNHEPLSALKGGKDGLELIKKLFAEAPAYAAQNSFIIAEIAPEQEMPLKDFLSKTKIYKKITTKKDLAGKTRFIRAEISETVKSQSIQEKKQKVR